MKNDFDRVAALGHLQKMQANFDRQHGFDFLAGNGTSDLNRVAFSSLALCGEVGELANQIKKAQRASWSGEDTTQHIAQAKLEVGGILAYLLKLSSDLELRLDETYLTTLSDNWLRFKIPDPGAAGRVLCIAGPSGSGKSSIVRHLADFGASTYVEDVAGNPFLIGLYGNSHSFDAHASQQWFLEQIESFVERSAGGSTLILDQDPAAVVRVYARLLREDRRMSDDAYVSLLMMLLRLESRLGIRQQRVTVFLDADERTLRQRMVERGDPAAPTEVWLQRVRAAFAELKQSSPNSRLVSTEGREAGAVAAEIATLLGLVSR